MAVQERVASKLPWGVVHVFGSSANGFGGSGSDVDLGWEVPRVTRRGSGEALEPPELLAELAKRLPAALYDAKDGNGDWWPITITGQSANGTYRAKVDGTFADGQRWDGVLSSSNMRERVRPGCHSDPTCDATLSLPGR